jgi:hypothetical protein
MTSLEAPERVRPTSASERPGACWWRDLIQRPRDTKEKSDGPGIEEAASKGGYSGPASGRARDLVAASRTSPQCTHQLQLVVRAVNRPALSELTTR